MLAVREMGGMTEWDSTLLSLEGERELWKGFIIVCCVTTKCSKLRSLALLCCLLLHYRVYTVG